MGIVHLPHPAFLFRLQSPSSVENLFDKIPNAMTNLILNGAVELSEQPSKSLKIASSGG